MTNENVKGLIPSLQDGLPIPKRYWAVIAIGVGISLSVIDGTITNVALPDIAKDLGVSSTTIIWVINAYQLAFTISILPLSALGDKYGYRKIFTWGLALFSITSVACFMSDSFSTLTFARSLQGIGAAALSSVSSALLKITYPKGELAKGMGLNALFVAVSLAAGPTIGGSILAVASWHWIFVLNIPLGVIAFCIAWFSVPDNPEQSSDMKIDAYSCILNALTFGLLVFAMDGIAHKEHWSLLAALGFGFVVVTYIYIKKELASPDPLLPVDLMKIRDFSVSIGTSIIAYTAATLPIIVLPFFLQDELKLSAFETGLLMVPWPVGVMITSPIAGKVTEWISLKSTSLIGLSLIAVGIFSLIFLPQHPSDMDLIWRLFLCGVGFGFFKTPNNSMIMGSVPEERNGSASGMLAMARLIGQTVGAAMVAIVFTLASNNSTTVSMIVSFVILIFAILVGSLAKTDK
jgi:DHA2 family multidrug resistance protein-like MFS transporter